MTFILPHLNMLQLAHLEFRGKINFYMTLNDAVFICVTKHWQWLASRKIDQIIHKSEGLFDPGSACKVSLV